MTDTALAEFTDELLPCVECSTRFLFSAGEQQYFKEKNLESKPKRCPECRVQRRRQRDLAAGKTIPEEFETVCSKCGRTTSLPFEPREGRSVFCRNCLKREGG